MNIRELTKMADNAYYAENYKEAIKLYQQILDQAPKNKNARTHLAKAELNLSLRTATPKIPIEALQLYKRSRSFITAGDLPQAKKLLQDAIAIAQKTDSKFPQAQELLDNLSNALTADEFSKKALEYLQLKLWANAVSNLETAVNLDQTNESNKFLLAHLRNLLIAQNLVSEINSGTKDSKKRSETIIKIREIIDATNELPVLSPLWQDVVRQLGDRERKNKNSYFQVMIAIATMLVIASGIVGGVSAQNYWAPGAYLALSMLGIALIMTLFAYSKR